MVVGGSVGIGVGQISSSIKSGDGSGPVTSKIDALLSAKGAVDLIFWLLAKRTGESVEWRCNR